MKNKHLLYKYIFPAALLLAGTAVHAQTNKPTSDNKVGSVSAGKVYTPAAYAGGTVTNTVNTWIPQQPYTLESDVTNTGRQVTEVMKSMQYVDGLGRSLQSIAWRISPGQKDIVAPVAYDEFGRPQHQFLPYASTGNDGSFKTNPFNDQKTFYTSAYPSEQPALQGEQLFYSKTVFEASPVNRIIKTLAPGNSWAGSENETYEKAVKIDYLANNSNDNVRIWRITYDNLTYGNDNLGVNIPASSAAYAAGQLSKTVIKDERGNAVVEYKDNSGKVILKKVQNGTVASDYSGYTNWLCTYYIYDDLGLLRFVLSPKAVKALVDAGSWSLSINSNLLIKELCFRYEYDERGRMIAKKVPGAAWTYMVYDIRDRLVFVQDGNLKVSNQWMTTLYDEQNRPVQTGIMTYSGSWTDLVTYLSTTQANSTSSVNGTNVTVPAGLYVNERVAGRTSYTATETITFDGGFSSEAGAEFTAEIVAGGSSFSSQQTVQNSPIPSGATFVPLTLTYYDSYAWTTKTYSTANNSQLDAGDNTYADNLPATASSRIRGIATGSRVRTLEDPANLSAGAWMETVNFYDDNGRTIQVNSNNYKGGTEVQTTRYGFGSQPVSSYYVHNNPAGGVSNLAVKTSMNYDHAGRLLNIKKKVNSEAVRTIAIYTYDAMGQVKNKKIGQQKDDGGALTSTPLENQDYAFNIRGWLKGINWGNYGGSGKTAAQNNRWFAMDLSYDWGYDNNQYNGNIAGMRWQSGSDKEERAYGFGYDAVNRLLYADFNQYTSGAFNKNAGVDFTVKMGDGINTSSAYDENGNILQMQQWGMKGTGSPQIDNLQYRYYDYSNKLKNVYDQNNDAVTRLGDFRTSANHPDGANTTASRIDYDYDVNGNLKKDLNKDVDDASIGGIVYNHLNLPWKVTVKNKGTITYIYDAAGNKLEKRIDEPAAAGNGYQARQVATSYVSGFIYENNVLQFFAQEEGRIRDKKDANGAHVEYAYDYFLKDHLGNVRMTLTEEKRIDPYVMVTFEDASTTNEQVYYEQANIERIARPGAFTLNSNSSDKVQLLRKSTASIGTGKLLKVMYGDRIHAKVDYYTPSGSVDNGSANGLSALLAQLGTLLNGASAPAALKGNGSAITSALNSQGAFTGFMAPQAGSGGSVPKAYLNILFFDDQFKFVQQGSESVPVTTMGGAGYQLARFGGSAIAAPKNGYVYVYISNESNNLVYFDNFQVSHERGPLMEENHYYAFGLTMAGISSRAIGMMGNNFKFNSGTELNTEFDWNMYETMFRGYDAQVGRFHQVDPMADEYSSWSPYTFSFNDPVFWNDPMGLEPGPNASVNEWIDWYLANGGGTITPNGNGGWTGQGYSGSEEAMTAFSLYMDRFNAWGQNGNPDFASFQSNFNESFGWMIQHTVTVEGHYNNNQWVTTNEADVMAQLRRNGAFWDGGSNGPLNQDNLLGNFQLLFDFGAAQYGVGELALQAIRRNNGAQVLGRAMGFGTQQTAKALRGTVGIVSKAGKVLGAVGYGLQAATIGYKFINGQNISTSEKVGFGVSSALVGAGAIAAGTVAAPFVAGAALVYGIAELGSYLFTGKTIEEHIFD